jgi:glycosyltransferase involved in cell wall biosynthesis
MTKSKSIEGWVVMPDDPLAPELGGPGSSPAEAESRTRDHSDRELVDRLHAELQAREREIRELRDQLRAIHTSDGWAMLRTLSQLREGMAPPGTRRDGLARLGVRALRRLKKGVAGLVQTTRFLGRPIPRGDSRPIRIDPAGRPTYAVVCLPLIEWGFRFQRPQQLMRQFAQGGHRVLYAANRFHRGTAARLRPVESNILEIFLPGDPAANIYQMLPAAADRSRMVEALERLRAKLDLADAVIVVQHPYWTTVSKALRERFGWPIVYDCMDDHAGFLHNGAEVLETERRLVAAADLVVSSSAVLLESVRSRARRAILLRNACEYEHFCRVGDRRPGRREALRVGYYGAIAEWFDGQLVAELAGLRRDWRFELIGSTLAGDIRPLRDAANIRLLGERPYDALPGLIGEWDVFIIPFKRVRLTEATNPVKVYEMLATGKPVVAVELPELVPIAREGLIRLAGTAREFATAIERELEDSGPAAVERRREFARGNTWTARYQELAGAIEEVRGARAGERPGAGASDGCGIAAGWAG